MSFPSFLRIAVNPEVVRKRVNSTTWEKSIVLDPLGVHYSETLAKALNFSYNFTTTSDGNIGSKDNGTWSGIIGMLHRQEADIAISALSPSPDRQEVLDFCFPFDSTQITFATRKPVYAPSLITILEPFTWEVWSLTIACSFVMAFVFSALLSRKHSVRKLFLYICSTILHEGVELRLEKPRDYILVMCWITGMMFLGYSYTAVLLAFMTFPSLEGVRTIPELAAAISKGRYYCTTFPGTALYYILKHSSDPDLQIIGNSLAESDTITDIDGALSDRNSSKIPAIVYARYSFAPLAAKYFISRDVFFSAMPSIAMAKNFCCIEQINREVHYIWASGMYNKWADQFTFDKSLYYLFQSWEEDDASERPLSMDDFMLIFFTLAAGLTLSAVVFAVELVVGNPRHSILKNTMMRLKEIMNIHK